MTNKAGPDNKPLPPFHPIPGLEAEEISGHQYHVATGEPNPCIHERMWWPTVPGELE